MDAWIDLLVKATVYFAVDANSRYWQVKTEKEDKNEATFISHNDLYRFVRMPFGSRKASRTFQRTMDAIPARFK